MHVFSLLSAQGWSQWQSLGCSVTCGTGVETRTRQCPTQNCPGSSQETIQCTLQSCPTQLGNGQLITNTSVFIAIW